MANSKISALTSATTPVAGTEVLPIVQSSATKQLSIANLTPGLSTITAAKGGTGQTSYAVGDLLYADTTTTLAKLADVATGNAIISGGVSTAPSYGKIGLTTHVNGILPVANGGTATSTAFTTGSVIFAAASGVYSQNNAAFFWDNTNGYLGLGTITPGYILNTYASSGSLSIQSVAQNNNAGSGVAAIGFNVSFVASEGSNTKGGIGFQRNAGFGGGFMAFYNNNSGAAGDFTTADEKMRIDSSGNVLVTSPAGLGYGTGAGGTVTQATSKATAVTLNKPTGQITMNAAALASNTTVSFTLTNSLIATTDNVVVTNAGGNGGSPNYQIFVFIVQAGSCLIAVRNISGGSLSESVSISFALIKGASS